MFKTTRNNISDIFWNTPYRTNNRYMFHILSMASLSVLLQNQFLNSNLQIMLWHRVWDNRPKYGTTDHLQSRVTDCVAIAKWMQPNRVQLNAGKNEFLWCMSAHHQHQLPTDPLVVGTDLRDCFHQSASCVILLSLWPNFLESGSHVNQLMHTVTKWWWRQLLMLPKPWWHNTDDQQWHMVLAMVWVNVTAHGTKIITCYSHTVNLFIGVIE